MKLKKIAALIAIAGLSSSAFATNGYFSHGYGMKAKGMGGTATAVTGDTFGGANNPAAMVWAGNRLDIGADLFSPQRSIERTGSGAGLNGDADSDSTLFLVPEFGYNRMLNQDMSFGVTVYGNGGMNTNYPGGQLAGGAGTVCGNPGTGFNPGPGPFNLLCGNGKLGINLIQLVIAPTFAMKANQNHSFGISPLIGYQRFKANGLDGFRNFTPSGTPNWLSDKGSDSAHGFGLRLGWLGKLSDRVTVGAAYSTKIKMSKFDKYRELFAEQGDFDMPANFNIGVAFQATQDLMVAADYQHIDYDGVKSVSNSSRTALDGPGTGIGGSLGCDDCRGFGWKSIDVFKLGVEYRYNPNLMLRAGYNHGENPIRSSDVTFNFIAPGVVKHHLTLGFTYNLSRDSELTMSYMHAFKESVKGASLFNAFGVAAGNEKIDMYQNALGVAYSMKFQ